jgi:hypothetical protein
MEDTTMTDPTPTLWTVSDIDELRIQHEPDDWTVYTRLYLRLTGPEYDALVQCVRDADRRLRAQERLRDQLDHLPPDLTEYGKGRRDSYVEALDLLVDGGGDGDTGHAAGLDDVQMRVVVEMQAQTEAWRDGGTDG